MKAASGATPSARAVTAAAAPPTWGILNLLSEFGSTLLESAADIAGNVGIENLVASTGIRVKLGAGSRNTGGVHLIS